MNRPDRRGQHSRSLTALFIAAALSGGAWITSQAIVQDAQRRAFAGGPSSPYFDPYFSVRWAIIVNFVAIPAFVVCLGAFSAVWIVRRQP